MSLCKYGSGLYLPNEILFDAEAFAEKAYEVAIDIGTLVNLQNVYDNAGYPEKVAELEEKILRLVKFSQNFCEDIKVSQIEAYINDKWFS